MALNVLNNDYEFIGVVSVKPDRDDDEISVAHISERFRSIVPSLTSGLTLRSIIDRCIEEIVYEPDKRLVYNATMRHVILENLQNNSTYKFGFRMSMEGHIRSTRLSFLPVNGGKDSSLQYIMTMQLVVEGSVDAEENTFAAECLLDDFEAIYLIDADKDIIEPAKISREFNEAFTRFPETRTYSDRVRMSVENNVTPEDKEQVLDKLSAVNVMKCLEAKSVCSFPFRIKDAMGSTLYYEAKTARRYGPGCRGFVLGLRSIDDTVREYISSEEARTEDRAKAEKELIRKTAELRDRNRTLARINDEIVEMLADVVEMRDSNGGEHIVKVKAFTNILAESVMENLPEYGLTEEDVELITSASILHDIGKILIPDAVLLKPGKLTDEEFKIMQGHCYKGCDILKRASRSWGQKYLNLALDICRYHHEKWDGNGYPEGLKGDEIPIAAQIVSIADCYDALTSVRVYNDMHEAEDAFDMILRGECGVFSDKLMKCLSLCRGKYLNALNNPQEIVEKYLKKNESEEDDDLRGLEILLVDDDLLGREINKEILEARGATVTEAADGEEALDLFDRMPLIDAVIMDIHMPKMDGIEATRRIREKNTADRVPIVAITADENVAIMDMMISAGADGSISKPLDIGELTHILLMGIRTRSSIMEEKLAASERAANIDPLTKVRNLNAYRSMTAAIEDEIHSSLPPEFGIVVCDINNLKTVNDTLGHEMGDVYIKNSCRIISETYAHSPVFRVGGDEFVVILRGQDYENREHLSEELSRRAATAQEYHDVISGKASFAAGMATFDRLIDREVIDVARRADEAMYINKRKFKKNHKLF